MINPFPRYWVCCYLSILIVTALNPIIFDVSSVAILRYFFPFFGLGINLFILLKTSSFTKITTEVYAILVLILLLIISSVVSTDFVVSFSRVIFATICLMYLYTSSLLDRRLLESVFEFLYWVSFGIIVWCYYLLVFYPLEYFNSGNFRGVFYNANYLGRVLALMAVPSILIRLNLKERPKRFFKLVNYLLIFSALFLLIASRSRASILAVVVLLVVFYLFKDRSVVKNTLVLVFSCVLFGITAYLVTPDKARQYIYADYVLKYESSDGIYSTRGDMYSDRILGIAEKPVYGWGYGIKPKLNKTNNDPKKMNDTEKGNSYLAFFEEVGLLAGIMYLGIFCLLLFQCARHTSCRADSKRRIESAILLGIILAGVVHANFESWLFYFGSFISNYFWLILLSQRSFRSVRNN